MTDFFALLEQPRQPWLDPAALKQKYHQLTRAAHPDVPSCESSTEFASINEAYRTLLDPKLRIHHLLALEAAKPSERNCVVPEELQELFLKIGSLTQNSQRLLEQFGNTKSELSRSLLKADLLDLQRQAQECLEQSRASHENCVAELHQLNTLWNTNEQQAIIGLNVLHDRIAYLSRWIAQLEEMQFQLSLY
jgi:DnaJ-domain-containing protein 1